MGSDLPVWIPGEGETAGPHRRSNVRAISAGLTFRPLATTVADMLAGWETRPETRQMNLKAGLTRERDPRCLRGWTSPNSASLQALRRRVAAMAAIAVVAFVIHVG